MIKLEIEIDDIDYSALAEQLLPLLGDRLRGDGTPFASLLGSGAAGPMAKALLSRTPKATKDRLAAELIEKNSGRLRDTLERAAADKGVDLRIGRIRAAAHGE